MPQEDEKTQDSAQPNSGQEKQAQKASAKSRAGNVTDPISGMSGREMAVGYWWVSHKLLFRKLGLSLLVALCAIFVGYSVYGWVTYLGYGVWKDRAMVAKMAEQPIPFRAYHKAHAPQDIIEGQLLVLDSGTKEGWKDIIVPVQNPNANWRATMTYHFEDGAEVTPDETMTVLPGEETIIGILGYAPTSTIGSPELVKTDMGWRKINPRHVADPLQYMTQRLDFAVSEPEITRPGEIKDIDTYKITFNITNNTIHSYWSVPFWVLLYRNDALVGVEQVILEPFELGETQTVDVRSLTKTRSVTDVKVVPRLDVFDEEIYKPLTDVLGSSL